MALTAGHVVFIAAIVVSFIRRTATARTASGPQSRPAFLAAAFNPLMPVDPLSKRCWKPSLDHGCVGLLHQTLPKLPGKVGGGRLRLGHHEHTRHRRIEPAHHAEECSGGTRYLEDREDAGRAPGSIGRGQTGRLDDGDQVVILSDRFQV